MRRHGTLERPAPHTLWDQLRWDYRKWRGEGADVRQGRVGGSRGEEPNAIEEGIRRARDRRAGGAAAGGGANGGVEDEDDED